MTLRTRCSRINGVSFTGALIGALAGAFAVLLYKLTHAKKKYSDIGKDSLPVMIQYKPKGDTNETDNSKQ